MLKYRLSLVALLLWFSSGAFAENNDLKTANRVVDSVDKKYAPDKRTVVFNLVFTENSGQILLKGKTNLPDAKRMVLDSLSILKISYVDSIIVLPSASLGDKIWGLVTLSVSNLRSKPDHESELVSQVLMGTPMKILDYTEGWYRIQTPDNYIGWMDSGGLARFADSEMDQWRKSNRYVFNRIFGNAFDTPNRKNKVVSDLVLNDMFEVESEIKGYLKMRFPDGRIGFVKKKDCLSWLDWTGRKPDVQSILWLARQMLGVPYTWGGTSCKTADCSGFTKTAYYSQGIILARDASQQAQYGQYLDFNETTNLQPGDLLFFGRNAQRIVHVGIYIENGWYIHASSAFGRVNINSIDPKNPAYVLTEKKKLVSASRILNSLNTDGITLVKDHPWYK